jgi:hypothetical protein
MFLICTSKAFRVCQFLCSQVMYLYFLKTLMSLMFVFINGLFLQCEIQINCSSMKTSRVVGFLRVSFYGFIVDNLKKLQIVVATLIL